MTLSPGYAVRSRDSAGDRNSMAVEWGGSEMTELVFAAIGAGVAVVVALIAALLVINKVWRFVEDL